MSFRTCLAGSRTCGPGAAFGVLRIVKNVSTAAGTSFAARRLRQDDHHAHSNYTARPSISPSSRNLCIGIVPLRAHLQAATSHLCAGPGWCAFARCPLTQPLQPRGILFLDSLEDGFFPWPPKTTDESHSSSLFSVQGKRESPPFLGKLPGTLNDLFRAPARRGPFTQKD